MITVLQWAADQPVPEGGFLNLVYNGQTTYRLERDFLIGTFKVRVNVPDPGFDYIVQIQGSKIRKPGLFFRRGEIELTSTEPIRLSKGGGLGIRLMRLLWQNGRSTNDTLDIHQIEVRSPFDEIRVELTLVDEDSEGWDDDPFDLNWVGET